MPNQSETKGTRESSEKAKSVHACNFRTAARLSNEDARGLTTLHEGFALRLSTAFDTHFSTPVEVKLQSVNQLFLKEHLEVAPCFIAPLSLSTLSSYVFVEWTANWCNRLSSC